MGSRSVGEAAARKPVRRRHLNAAMRDASMQARSLDAATVLPVRDIQAAHRNYGKVELMLDAAGGGTFVAVKRMPNTWVCSGPGEFAKRYPGEPEKPWREVGLLRLLNALEFQHVCRLHAIFRSDQETLVATSFCADGDLSEWCFGGSAPPVGAAREDAVRPIAIQICAAVRELHDLGIAHCDLSLENILLERGSVSDASPKVKLIDFGMSTLRRVKRIERYGKLMYQAPEVHGGVAVDTFLADAFAVGVVLFTLGAQRYPWSCTRRGACSQFGIAASRGVRSLLAGDAQGAASAPLGDVLSGALVELLEALLDVRPAARASLGEAAFRKRSRRQPRRNAMDMAFLKDAAPCPNQALSKIVEMAHLGSEASTCSMSSCVSAGLSTPEASPLWRRVDSL